MQVLLVNSEQSKTRSWWAFRDLYDHGFENLALTLNYISWYNRRKRSMSLFLWGFLCRKILSYNFINIKSISWKLFLTQLLSNWTEEKHNDHEDKVYLAIKMWYTGEGVQAVLRLQSLKYDQVWINEGKNDFI